MSAETIEWLSQHTVPQWVWALAHMAFQQPAEHRRAAFHAALQPLLENGDNKQLRYADFSWIAFEDENKAKRRRVVEDSEDDSSDDEEDDCSSKEKDTVVASDVEKDVESSDASDSESDTDNAETYTKGRSMVAGGFYRSFIPDINDWYFYRVDKPADYPDITWLYSKDEVKESYTEHEQALPRGFDAKYTDRHLFLSTHNQKRFEVPKETYVADALLVMNQTQPLEPDQFYVTALFDIGPDRLVIQELNPESIDWDKRMNNIADALIQRGNHGKAKEIKQVLLDVGPLNFARNLVFERQRKQHTCFACRTKKLCHEYLLHNNKKLWIGRTCARYLDLAWRMYHYTMRGEDPEKLQFEWTNLTQE
jgi:hypothetical protein